jgi:Uma2 family endonuclease
MNEHFLASQLRPTTRAAEGLPRWRWTVAEMERIAAGGFFRDQDQFELIGGEMAPMMSPAGRRHETIRIKLARRMNQLAQSTVMIASEPQFNLAPDTFVKPDILVHSDAINAINTYDLKGSEAWLLIEVAETSLGYDLKTKRPLYASHGVPEYWVINAATLMTTVHRQPAGNLYTDIVEVQPDARLVPSLAPELAVSLNELDLD